VTRTYAAPHTRNEVTHEWALFYVLVARKHFLTV